MLLMTAKFNQYVLITHKTIELLILVTGENYSVKKSRVVNCFQIVSLKY